MNYENEILNAISKNRRWVWLGLIIEIILLSFLWYITGGYLEMIDTVNGPKYVLNGTSVVFIVVIVLGIVQARESYVKIEMYKMMLKIYKKSET
jgi:hypothetical protein